MHNEYAGVTTRFLNPNERLVLSKENEMPFVIEAKEDNSVQFLQAFLISNTDKILNDMSHYGAVLLRGFNIVSEEDFETTVLSIRGMKGISEAFMSEQGRIHVGNSKYVLHTNAVYKTGGTLYLGGFHSENYYSTDVPTYISFCCLKPSSTGGETGIINMEKIYPFLDQALQTKLEKNNFFVSKWLMSEVAERYHLSDKKIEAICKQFDLPVVTVNDKKFILMYKPNVFIHPVTNKKSLQINYFELPTLNAVLRKKFIKDYPGKMWFWHRFVWRLPDAVLKIPEVIYMVFASLFYSPKESFKIIVSKYKNYMANRKNKDSLPFNDVKVKSCFNEKEIKALAQLMRDYYCSCLWQKGDILLVDNRKVVHAGMPGSGPRTIRAMICNPLDMRYSDPQSGLFDCKSRNSETVGFYMSSPESEGVKSAEYTI